jgi:hypothetical protein
MDRISRTFGAGWIGYGMERSSPVPPTLVSAATPKNGHRDVLLKKNFAKEKLGLIPEDNKNFQIFGMSMVADANSQQLDL